MMGGKRFIERVPELRKLEGWYNADGYKFKLSCRFKDILRCSEFNGKTTHFISCFARYDCHSQQPLLRCYDPTWGIIYTPDKHGNFMGRAWVRLVGSQLQIGRVYGNRLTVDTILIIMKNIGLDCQVGVPDTYLEMRA